MWHLLQRLITRRRQWSNACAQRLHLSSFVDICVCIRCCYCNVRRR